MNKNTLQFVLYLEIKTTYAFRARNIMLQKTLKKHAYMAFKNT